MYKAYKAVLGGVALALTASEQEDVFVFGVDRDDAGDPYGSELTYGEGWDEYDYDGEGGYFNELFSNSIP